MLHTLMQSIREYKRMTIISPILVVAEAAIETFIPFLMAAIIDQAFDPAT